MPRFTVDASDPQVQCDFDGEAHGGKVDLAGTEFTLLIVGMKVCCDGKIGEITALVQAQQCQATVVDNPQGVDSAMGVDTGMKRHADDAEDGTASAAKKAVLEKVPAKAAPPTVHLARAIGGVVDAAAAAAADELSRGSADASGSASGQAASGGEGSFFRGHAGEP